MQRNPVMMTHASNCQETITYHGSARILNRQMARVSHQQKPVLDAVSIADNEIRLFFPISPDPKVPPFGAVHHRLRGASCLIASPSVLQDELRGTIPASETHIFAGKNVIFGQRIDEDPTEIATSLRYHHQHHGMTAALILNRYPPDSGQLENNLLKHLKDLDLSVVIWNAAIALGQPAAPAESHLSRAPDGPNGHHLSPSSDPWRSKLQQPWLYEAARWRFLQAARMVWIADFCDILSPETVEFFNQNHEFKDGIRPIYGRRIYPWRWRKGRTAAIADHICQRFDCDDFIASWAIQPPAIAKSTFWKRPRFIPPPRSNPAEFHRAMAIRHPTAKAKELAPKSSLIEAQPLVERARNVFGHKALSPPRLAAKPLSQQPLRTTIITTMKNEGPFILEWIAHHRAIGVDDFLIYTNNCSDGTTELLQVLDKKGLIKHRINPWKQGDEVRPQHRALQEAEAEPVLRDSAWCICMDVDEFIAIKIGDGTLPALYQAMGDANMISLTWKMFGNADLETFQPDFITDQFTRCAPAIIRKPHQAWGFKTLFRNLDLYRKLGVHRPKGIRTQRWAEIGWLNGSGQPMPKDILRNGWRSTLESYGYDWVQLNHYAVRSAQSFLVKRDRGRVNHIDRDQGLGYWFCMNHNAEEDHSIARSRPLLQAEFDRLMAHHDIAQAHDHCIAAHRAKIDSLLTDERTRGFLAEITSPRMQKLCRLQKHFGAAVFAQGPHCLPATLDLDHISADFFFTPETDTPPA